MPAFIYCKSVNLDNLGRSHVMYWNRRKKVWQTNLTKSCIYPTFKGTNRTARKLFNAWPNMRPHDDCIGQKDLASFARDNYKTFSL